MFTLLNSLCEASFGPDGTRDWQNPAEIAAREEAERMPSEQRPTPLNSQQTFAEFLHIIRPIAHRILYFLNNNLVFVLINTSVKCVCIVMWKVVNASMECL